MCAISLPKDAAKKEDKKGKSPTVVSFFLNNLCTPIINKPYCPLLYNIRPIVCDRRNAVTTNQLLDFIVKCL